MKVTVTSACRLKDDVKVATSSSRYIRQIDFRNPIPVQIMARFVTAFAFIALLISGCKTLSFQGQEVKVTHHLEDVAECHFLGEVTAQPPFVGPKDGENTVRNKTAEIGGDVVYYKRGQIGTLVGRSFDCAGRYASR